MMSGPNEDDPDFSEDENTGSEEEGRGATGGSIGSASAASRNVDPAGTIRFSDLVNLHEAACLVRMRARDGGSHRACGNPRATCDRPGHQRFGPDRRADPGY